MKFQFKAKTTSTGISFKKSDLLDGLKDVPVDTSVLVFITDQRNIEQNSLLHLYLSEISNYTGESLDDIKAFLKHKFLGYVEHEVKGVKIKELRSTTSLTVKEFALFITQIESWAWEKLNITLNKKMYEY